MDIITNESESNQKVEYLRFEDLTNFEKNTDFNKLAELIISTLSNLNSNWMNHFNSIVELRRLRKFHQDKFPLVFHKIFNIFPEYLNSIRSNIAKGSMILVTEIFSFYEFDYVSDWIRCLLPVILLKSSSDKKFLREEAMKALANAGGNMFYFETIEVLIEESGNKSTIISDNASNTLVSLISIIDEVNLENVGDWNILFQKLCDLYNLKRETYVKKTHKFITSINEKLGDQLFLKLVNSCKNDNVRNNIEKIVTETKQSRKKSDLNGFRQFVKENKK
jgi:hypothetical protein